MPKNFDDVVVPERRKTIRNIPIPQRERAYAPEEGRRKNDRADKADAVKRSASELEADYSAPPTRLNIPHGRRGRKRNLWIALGVAVLILVFAVLSMFNGATLAYTPRSAKLSFEEETYKAKKTGETDLIYSVVKLSGEKGVEVSVSGEEQVERKASGVIVVYNDASAEPQKLIENTRFESPSRKIYRIKSAISIPGK